jgi:hypothetical protein
LRSVPGETISPSSPRLGRAYVFKLRYIKKLIPENKTRATQSQNPINEKRQTKYRKYKPSVVKNNHIRNEIKQSIDE